MISPERVFAHPWVLWLLVLPPLLSVLALVAGRFRRRALLRLGQGSSAESPLSLGGWSPHFALLTARRPLMLFFQGACRSTGMTLLILACAGPQWRRDPLAVTAPGRDLVVVLDMSRSMLADDVVGSTSPNRLGRAIDGLNALVNAVEQRGGHRLGLVVFAARPRVACPLTHDYDHFRDALAHLEPDDPALAPAPGSDPPPSDTRIGLALRLAAGMQDLQARGFQDILLVSDGDDPADDREWQAGIAAARDHLTPVYTVGIGDPERGARIPTSRGYLYHDGKEVWTRLRETVLEDIADRTGGVYTAARTEALPLDKVFREQIEPRGGREEREDLVAPLQEHAAIFFAPALFLIALDVLIAPSARRRRRRRQIVQPPIEV